MSTSDLSITTTHTPTSSDLDTFLALLSQSYQHVPLTTAFITEIDNVSPNTAYEPVSSERLKQHFALGLPAAFRSNVVITRASTPTSASGSVTAAILVEPPDFSGTPAAQARKQPGPILSSYRAAARSLKARHLSMPNTGPHQWDTPAAPSQASSGPSGDPYPSEFNKDVDVEVRAFYHVSFLVRQTTDGSVEYGRGDGYEAASAVIRPFLLKAKDEDVPILVEANTVGIRSEFESWGFKTLEEITIGQGRVDEKGWPSEDGKGVKVWGMVYNM